MGVTRSIYLTNDSTYGLAIGIGDSGQANNSDDFLDLTDAVKLGDIVPFSEPPSSFFNPEKVKELYGDYIEGKDSDELSGLRVEKSGLINQCVVPFSEED